MKDITARILFGATLLCLVFASGCEKVTYDLSEGDTFFSAKPKEASPPYTVQYNQNLSPAEGGVQKPTN